MSALTRSKVTIAISFISAVFALGLITGCGTGLVTGNSPIAVPPVASVGGRIQGSAHGGQQPVSGATIQLYAVTTGGYFAPATSLLTTPVITASDGTFSITGDYSCTGVDQVYVVAIGGNPGLPGNINNGSLALMAALGTCSTLKANASTTFINMNEVTTVAGAWALAQFMNSPTNAGTSASNVTGLENAFITASKISNISTGNAPGPALPAGATLPIAEINTLADILSTCVNSNGSTASGSACGSLFTAATPPGGVAPADTLTAALNIARNPANNVSALFALSAARADFQPTLSVTPANWLIGIRHTGGGLAQPTAVAIDAAGNVWAANAANSVSEFSPAGAALAPNSGYTAGSLSSPSAIAIDLSGNAWVTNLAGSITRLAPLGASATNYTAGGLSQPAGIAIDGSGNVWIANNGNGSVSGLTSSGSVITGTPYSGAGINAPSGIAVSAH